jgi:hypothetical protein
MANGTFATAINCIDGRTTRAVMDWLALNLHVDYIDLITEPGPDKFVTQGTPAQLEDLKRKVQVSVEKHHSRALALVAHYDCAGNPVERAEHEAMIRLGAQRLLEWNLGVRVLGLWVNDFWQIEKICDQVPETSHA